MITINEISKPVPYIVEDGNKYVVVFIEPGTTASTYEFSNLRDAKICANEVLPLIEEVVNEGKLSSNLISNEVFEVEPIVKESYDQYGFKTITTEYWKGDTVIELFDSEGNKITEQEKQELISQIEEERRLAELALLDSEGNALLDSEGNKVE